MTMPPVEIDLDAVRAARVLGRGAMGTVFLVIAGGGGEGEQAAYALKVFDKRAPAAAASSRPACDAARRARWEVSVLSRLAHHPHLPSLLGSAETAELLAWAVPYCPGGDLNELRHAQPDRVFSPAAIRFYVAEVVSALAELHAAGIAYRDLKPENVLLRADGHVTLTDFDLSRQLPPKSPSASTSTSSSSSGSASSSPPPQLHSHGRSQYRHHLKRIFKRSESSVATTTTSSRQEEEQHNLAWYLNRSDGEVKKAKSARVSPADRKKRASFCSTTATGNAGEMRSFSFVGTEEYVAPEVVRGDGHEFAVDWWALGVLVYEMACGKTPFRGRTRRETFRNVLLREPEFSADARRRWPDLTDLIMRLLEKEPARRLGFAGGADEVRAHPFFAGVAWELLGEVCRPPYIPPPTDDTVSCEGFSVADYFNKLHHAAPPSPADHSPEDELLPEF